MSLPVLVICYKLPYTKAGLNSLGSIVNQDFVLQYLREWLDPSMVQSPDYVAMSSQEMRLAESTISQLLPNAGLKERLSQILIQCQDFISSCAYGGVTMSGFECCRQVEPFLATLNGICWTFKLNQTNMQSTIGYPQGLPSNSQ
uniref:Uncharacterized protein n=1 Tax=Ditylenchus dipsaci TaxID=166011 RepID=A0A915E784_9BILA